MSYGNPTFQQRLKQLIDSERWDRNTSFVDIAAILRAEAVECEARGDRRGH